MSTEDMGDWMVCVTCGAGPFLENGERFKHWYDAGHLRYYVVYPPEDGVERPYDQPADWCKAQQIAESIQEEFDLSEPS